MLMTIDLADLARVTGGDASTGDAAEPPGKNRTSASGQITVTTPFFSTTGTGTTTSARTDYGKCLESRPMTETPDQVRAACGLPNGQP